jgi:hypothetical protein
MSTIYEAKLIFGVPLKRKKKYKFGTVSFLGEEYSSHESKIEKYVAKYGYDMEYVENVPYGGEGGTYYICLENFGTEITCPLSRKDLIISNEKLKAFGHFLSEHKIKQIPRWYLTLVAF